MKKKYWILFISLIVVVIILIWLLSHISFNKELKQNVENSQKVEIGMNINEVLIIMGEPDERIISFFNEKDSMLYYEPPFGASSGIYFQFENENRLVTRIIPYE